MTLPEAHLTPPSPPVTRRQREAGWPYSLGEAHMPRRVAGAPGAAAALTAIGDWLDVENLAAHIRWAPRTSTYCNIYAHDYCALAGAYLPRVWWTPAAIRRLNAGETVAPAYGKSVGELNANALHAWLVARGADFGWTKVAGVGAAQDAANAGKVVVWSGAKKDAKLSGHITMIVPENAGHTAKRDAAGAVLVPLQSQAGRSNCRYHTRNLFTGDSWRASFIWMHD
jgi:hypothetical protein